MQNQDIKNNLKNTLATSATINIVPTILADIRAGRLQIVRKKNTTLLRFLGWATLLTSLLLNIFALYYVVHNFLAEQTLSFLQFTISDYSSLAWSAVLESVPWLTLVFFVLAVLDLTFVMHLRSRYIKNNYFTN